MLTMIEHVQETIDGIVFGNGWLALGGLALLVAFTVLIRLLPGIRV